MPFGLRVAASGTPFVDAHGRDGGRAAESVTVAPQLASRLMSPSLNKFTSQVVLDRAQLTLYATRRTSHGASGLVRAMSAWLVKTRHAPSRHCRNAMV